MAITACSLRRPRLALALVVSAVSGGLLVAADKAATISQPPVAAKVPHVEVRLGKPVADDYFWLRHRNDPRVLKYLAEENNYTTAWLRDAETLQQQLFHEMLARIQETDRSVPESIGEYAYYTRTVAGKPYKIHCRRKGVRRQPDYDYIRSYSPYDNVRPQTYPSLLVTAGLHDPRVCYWEPAKWVARLRAVKTPNRTLLLKTNLDAGHGGRSGRYGVLEDISLAYAFILKELGAR